MVDPIDVILILFDIDPIHVISGAVVVVVVVVVLTLLMSLLFRIGIQSS